jgi:hypothetical protein
MSETTQGSARPRPSKPAKPKLTQCGLGNSIEAKRTATAILEVLAGVRTPTQAAEAVGMSIMRYYQVEARAVQGLVSACEPRRRGPERTLEREVKQLRRQQQRLEQELGRQQALARMAQRSLGLVAPKVHPPAKGKKWRRRPASTPEDPEPCSGCGWQPEIDHVDEIILLDPEGSGDDPKVLRRTVYPVRGMRA